MLRPVGKQRVAEEIVTQLRSLILKGSYAPGDKLPPERKLAQDLGVNRASLREAIKTLEHMGLVKTRQGDGTRVLDFMQTAGVELVSHLIPIDGRPNAEILRDVLEFRRWFGGLAARLAAERGTAADLARLNQIATRAAASTTPEEMLSHDFEFYVALTQAGHNRVMQLLINTMRAAVVNFSDFFAQGNPAPTVTKQTHQQIVEAVRKRDGQSAERAADDYLAKASAKLVGLLKP